MFDVCIVGPVTRDSVVIGEELPVIQPGGVPVYAAAVYRALGLETAVVTRLARRDEDLLAGLEGAGAVVFPHFGDRTTTFENAYPAGLAGARVQRVLERAAPFEAGDVQPIEARLWHLGPLTPEDLPADVVRAIAGRGGQVALDAQGLVRRVAGEAVTEAPLVDTSVLGFVSILKADRGEASMLSGSADPATAAARIAAMGPAEVAVTLGAAGALVHADAETHEIPAIPPRRLGDATGAGDSWFAGYLARRLAGDDVVTASRLAAAVATLKLECVGPFSASMAEVEETLAAL